MKSSKTNQKTNETEEITELTAAQQTRLDAIKELGQDMITANKAYAAAKAAGNVERADKIKKLLTKLAAQKLVLGEDDEQTKETQSHNTVYPDATVIKTKNGHAVGEIYPCENGWGCFHYNVDSGYDCIDSKQDAVACLKDMHQEYLQNKGKLTNVEFKPVAESNEGDWGDNPFEAHGVKGANQKVWRKIFKNGKQAAAWCEKNDADILGMHEIDPSQLQTLTRQQQSKEWSMKESEVHAIDSLDNNTIDEASSVNKQYGVRWKAFTGRDQRITTKERFFGTQKALDAFVDRLVLTDGFYEIDAWSLPQSEEQEVVHESNEGVDEITMTVPLFIRCLEWAREDAPDDVALHQFTENAVTLDRCLDIEDYEGLVPAGSNSAPTEESTDAEQVDEISDAAARRLLQARMGQAWKARDVASMIDSTQDDIDAAVAADDRKFKAFNAVGKRANRLYGPNRQMGESATLGEEPKARVHEDASAGASCSAAVATVVPPLTKKTIKRAKKTTESAEYAADIVYGNKAPGIKEKIDRWFFNLMFVKPGDQFIDAERAERRLEKAGFNQEQRTMIRDCATAAAYEVTEFLKKKYPEEIAVPKYVSTLASHYQVFNLYLNVSEKIHNEFRSMAKKLFNIKLNKIRDKLELSAIGESNLRKGVSKESLQQHLARNNSDTSLDNAPITELDNGPSGRVNTDNINYDSRRNSSGGGIDKEELIRRKEAVSKQKAIDAALRRNGTREQERQWALEDAQLEPIKLGYNFDFEQMKKIAEEYAGANDIVDVTSERQFRARRGDAIVAGVELAVVCQYDPADFGIPADELSDGLSDAVYLRFIRDPDQPKKIIFSGFGG